jgi:hypothetical protein
MERLEELEDGEMHKTTTEYCHLMFDLCTTIQSVISERCAREGLELASIVEGAFAMGLLLPIDCPVVDMLSHERTRLVKLLEEGRLVKRSARLRGGSRWGMAPHMLGGGLIHSK